MSKQPQTTAGVAAAASAAVTSSLQAESSEQSIQHQNSNPFVNIFANFLKLFNLVRPHPPQKKNLTAVEDSPAVDEEVKTEIKPVIIRYPQHKDENLPSIKLEPEEIQERNTNPVVLWQVYAIGGFLVLRWAWTRWNERRTRKKASDEEPPPATD